MVCQAASQTRFRALKHESGIAGNATIIVRVIACFQPLQDCQVIDFGWMGEDCGSWLPLQQHFDWQSSNMNSLRVPLNLGQQNSISAYMNPCTNMVTANGTLPACAFPELPQSRAGQANELHGWFYCLPRFRHNFAPPANSIFKEKLCVGAHEDSREVVTPNAGSGSGCAQKKFLVFDQSGDQTTLIFSSGIGAPVQCLTSWGQKPPVDYNLNADDLGTKMDPIHHPSQIVTDEFNGTRETDVGSEMHEDTEELNALLYSDDGSDYTDDDDEVTSTGHSPSIMTAHIKQDWFEGITEEIVSSDGPTTRQKLVDGVYELPSLVDTSNSVKRKRSSEYEDDAQSSSGNGQNPGPVENDFLYGNKRMRKERIRETVSILQSIIPSGKGKDAIVVLDEAIHYLKSLKLKAKVLGLN